MLVAAAVALSISMVAAAPAAAARWGAPFSIEPPGTLDLLAPRLTLSAGGAGAATFSIQNVDLPGSSQAYVALLGGRGYPRPPRVARPRTLGGTAQVLALAYDGRWLELLTGSAARGHTCCARAQVIRVPPRGRPWRPRTVVGGLAGAASGRLLTLGDGQMLAAVATQRGVWASQAPRADRFTHPHRLTGRGQMPESLAAAWLGGEQTIVAWTAATGTAGASDPGAIRYAIGSRRRAPERSRTAVRVAAGHRIDELGLAPRNGVATAAWIESWYDSRGGWHSQLRAKDIGPGAKPRTLSSRWRQASGLTFSGDQAGDQAVSWESCTSAGACTAKVAVRRAGGSFGHAHALGAVDPGQPPSVAVGPAGEVVVGLVRGGRPFAATEAAPGRHFSRPVALSRTTYAYDVTVAAGSARRAIAAWSQGTLNPSVVAAAFRG